METPTGRSMVRTQSRGCHIHPPQVNHIHNSDDVTEENSSVREGQIENEVLIERFTPDAVSYDSSLYFYLNNIVSRFKHQTCDSVENGFLSSATKTTKDLLSFRSLPEELYPYNLNTLRNECNDETTLSWKQRSLSERRRLFARKHFWTMDNLQVVQTNGSSDGRQDMRRNSSMILFGKQSKSRRDSVVALKTQQKQTSRTSITGTKHNASQRRASLALPHFLHRSRSSIDADFSPSLTENTDRESDVITRHFNVSVDIPVIEKNLGEEVKFIVQYQALKKVLESVICKSQGTLTIQGCETESLRKTSNFLNRKTSVVRQSIKENVICNGAVSLPEEVNGDQVKQVVEKMKSNPRDYVCQLAGCQKMTCLATADSVDALMCKQDGISAVVQALKVFKDRRELVVAGCETLSRITRTSDTSCVQICRGGGVPVMLSILRHYMNKDVSVLDNVLDILANISVSGDDCTDIIVQESGHSEALSLMCRYPDNGHVTRQCCYILGNVVNTVQVAQSVMYVGGVHAIIGAMNRFTTDTGVLESCCRALGCFSTHDEICLDVANAGAVKSTLSAMAAGEHTTALQECGCWALACLTKCDESCEEFCQNGGVDILTKVLKIFRKEEAVQEYGSWTFCNVAVQDNLVNQIAREDVLSCLLDTMAMFSTNIELQEQIFFAISQIVMSRDDRQEQIVVNGGIPTVVNIMTSFPDNQDLQEHGCRIVGNIAVKDHLRKAVEADGASKSVISAMLTHDRNEQIQMYGCMALTNLTANVKENKHSVVKNSGVAAVLTAMKEMIENEIIVMCGLKTLANLMEVGDACFYFVDEDGIDLINMVLHTFNNSQDAQQFSALILCNLSSTTGIVQEAVAAAEGMLIETLSLSNNDLDVSRSLCYFYENVVLSDRGCEEFLSKSCIARVEDLIELYPNDRDLQLSVCKTIAAIAMRNKIRRCFDDNIIVLMLTTMTRLKQYTDILTVCCGALSYMTEHDDDLRSCVIKHEGVAVIINSLQDHAQDERLLVVGMMCLDSVLKTETEMIENQTSILKVVTDAMERYPDNIEIQIYGCNVITVVGKEVKNVQRHQSCDRVTDILSIRKSSPDLTHAAVLALQSLLSGQDEEVMIKMKERLPHLGDNVWRGCLISLKIE